MWASMADGTQTGRPDFGERPGTRAQRGVGALGVLLLAIALGPGNALAVKPAEVFVEGRTSFAVDPSLGYEQYFGTIHYGKVSVIRPLDATLTKRVIKKARR